MKLGDIIVALDEGLVVLVILGSSFQNLVMKTGNSTTGWRLLHSSNIYYNIGSPTGLLV
jgi:hypothetical protein